MANISIHRVTNLTELNAQAQKSAIRVDATDQSYIVVQFNIVSQSYNGEEQLGVSLFLKTIVSENPCF